MINTSRPETYIRLLGQSKMVELWREFERETRRKLCEEVANWTEKEQTEMLRNFFHACRSGALTYGMNMFAARCAEWEEYFLSGGSAVGLAEQLPDIVSAFDKEAAEVTDYLGERA